MEDATEGLPRPREPCAPWHRRGRPVAGRALLGHGWCQDPHALRLGRSKPVIERVAPLRAEGSLGPHVELCHHVLGLGDPGLLHPDPGPDGERPIVQASKRGHRRRPLWLQLHLAQHLPDPLDRGLDIDPGALLHRAIRLLIATAD